MSPASLIYRGPCFHTYLVVSFSCAIASCGSKSSAQPSNPSTAPSIYRQPSIAVPWSNEDQTAALQSAISSSDQHKSAISLFGADYLISDTLTWGTKIGLGLYGVAPGISIRPHPNIAGVATRLVWRGSDDGRPMLILQGSHASLGGFALSGKLTRNDVPATSLVGIRIEKVVRGVGTGKSHFSMIGCHAMDVGIQIGAPGAINMHNCDLISCDWYNATNVRAAYQINNQMGMGHHFGNVVLRGCETFAEVFAGGDLVVDKLFTAGPCTLLSIRAPGPGPNNGLFRISNVKVDQQAGSGFKLLSMEGHSPIDVTFDGGIIAYDNYATDDATLVDAVGGCRIVLRDWRNLQPGMIKLTAVKDRRGKWLQPHVTIETSRLNVSDAAELIHADSTGPFTFVVRDCANGYGKAIPDWRQEQ